MKNKLIIAVLLLCFSIGLCIFEAITVDKITNEATEMLTAIKSTSSSGQSSKELTELCKELSEFWEEKRWILEMLVEHKTIDEVESCTATMLELSETGAADGVRCKSAKLTKSIINIKETAHPEPGNVL